MAQKTEHIIDGSQGEGGGQVLRTSLTLAMSTGSALRVENIRAGRSKPGLMRAHLAAVRAAAQVSGAELTGAEIGSTKIEFRPQAAAICGGTYRFAIGTAGSTTLLLQTLLPVLAQARQPSLLLLAGGTHNTFAPSVDYIERAFLPALTQMGLKVHSELLTYGFFPGGGGEWHVEIDPIENWQPFNVHSRGRLKSRELVASVANLPLKIAERELAQAAKDINLRKNEMVARSVDSPGPGNIVSARFRFENTAVVFEERGARGVSAERVADRLTHNVRQYFSHEEPIDEHLADQLMLPMVLGAGGSYRTTALTEHSRTNIAVIEQILGRSCFQLHEESSGVLVQVKGNQSP